MTAVLKTVGCNSPVGSNPTAPANPWFYSIVAIMSDCLSEDRSSILRRTASDEDWSNVVKESPQDVFRHQDTAGIEWKGFAVACATQCIRSRRTKHGNPRKCEKPQYATVTEMD